MASRAEPQHHDAALVLQLKGLGQGRRWDRLLRGGNWSLPNPSLPGGSVYLPGGGGCRPSGGIGLPDLQKTSSRASSPLQSSSNGFFNLLNVAFAVFDVFAAVVVAVRQAGRRWVQLT